MFFFICWIETLGGGTFVLETSGSSAFGIINPWMIVHVVHVFPLELRYKMNRILEGGHFFWSEDHVLQSSVGWPMGGRCGP